MAKGYRPVDRDQPFLLPPDMREWLPAGSSGWLVGSGGGAGTAGYDPDMLVTVLMWAYAHGVTSSREVERLCHTDVAFRVICGGNLPDHVTFARVRGGFPGAGTGLFAEMLRL